MPAGGLIEELRASAPHRLSGETLAGRLGVSVRTVERDISAGRAAGAAHELQELDVQ